jgi:hypothetical protein
MANQSASLVSAVAGKHRVQHEPWESELLNVSAERVHVCTWMLLVLCDLSVCLSLSGHWIQLGVTDKESSGLNNMEVYFY